MYFFAGLHKDDNKCEFQKKLNLTRTVYLQQKLTLTL